MKKYIIFMMTVLGLVAGVHPDLKLKKADIFQRGWEFREVELMTFTKDNEAYEIILVSNSGDEKLLDSYDIDTEILSIFYDDLDQDGLREVFVLTRKDEMNRVEVYSEVYNPFEDDFDIVKLYNASNYLTHIFALEEGLSASKIREVVRGRSRDRYKNYVYMVDNNLDKTFDIRGVVPFENTMLQEWKLPVALKFEKGKDSIKVALISQANDSYVLDTYEADREIIRFFFWETTGDTKQELFVVTKSKGEYRIEVYTESRKQDGTYNISEARELENYINMEVKGDRVEDILEEILIADFDSLGIWHDMKRGNFYEGVDFFRGILLRGARIDRDTHRVEGAPREYLVDYGNGVFARFVRDMASNFRLLSIYEGYYVGDEVEAHGRFEDFEGSFYKVWQYDHGEMQY